MSIIPLTIFFSLFLAGLFVILFFRERRLQFGGTERESLLPLADETARPQVRASALPSCACPSGSAEPQPLCLGCPKTAPRRPIAQ